MLNLTLFLFLLVLTSIGLVVVLLKRKHWISFLLICVGGGLTTILVNLAYKGTNMEVAEHRSFYYTEATHYERWDEYIEKTCYREECTGSGKDRKCKDIPYNCDYVEDHPERWIIEDNAGSTMSISSDYYNQVKSLWGNEKFIDMKRDYHSIDGDAYSIKLPDSCHNAKSARLLGHTGTYSYKNKVKFSRSIFKFKDIPDSVAIKEGLFTWPTDDNVLLGHTDPVAESALHKANWLWGSNRQIYLMLIVFKDKPMDIAFEQESYWNGGNKNEFIVCVGVRDSTISWVKNISWTTNEMLKVVVRDSILNMNTFDAKRIARYMRDEIPSAFTRRQFKEFDYLPDLETGAMYIVPMIVMLVLFIVALVVSFKMQEASYTSSYGRRQL